MMIGGVNLDMICTSFGMVFLFPQRITHV